MDWSTMQQICTVGTRKAFYTPAPSFLKAAAASQRSPVPSCKGSRHSHAGLHGTRQSKQSRLSAQHTATAYHSNKRLNTWAGASGALWREACAELGEVGPISHFLRSGAQSRPWKGASLPAETLCAPGRQPAPVKEVQGTTLSNLSTTFLAERVWCICSSSKYVSRARRQCGLAKAKSQQHVLVPSCSRAPATLVKLGTRLNTSLLWTQGILEHGRN